MPASQTQISAFVSATTKEEIERYTRETGVRKNHLVEEALQHHLLALRELPADIIVHRDSSFGALGIELATGLQRKPKPTAKLRALMSRDDDD